MDLSKQLEFFNPEELKRQAVHVIGCGAIGSHIVDTLAHMGVQTIHVYDFDTVTEHNIANQAFTAVDINAEKTVAITAHATAINPEINIIQHKEGYKRGMMLSGYIFLAVDNIDLRRAIAEEHTYNPNIKAMFDFRLGLTDAQHYACNWEDKKQIKNFIGTMQFSHEEAKEATPVSACGTTLSVIPTVRTIVSLGISNWINFVKKGEIKNVVLVDAFSYNVIAM